METLIAYKLMGFAIYLILGALFTLFFFVKGITKVDSGTEETGWVFKLLIFPGMLIFWPLFLNKWIKSN